MPAWARVRDLVTSRDAGGLADFVIALSDAGRAEVARRLPELRDAASVRASERLSLYVDDGDEWDEPGDGIGGHGEVLRIAPAAPG